MMRQVEVDTDVFALIWSRRNLNEETENQILRRILLEAPPPKELILPGSLEPPSTRTSLGEKEVNSSKPRANPEATTQETEVGKIRWVDDVQAALRMLGGRASLHRIYKAVEERRREARRSLPRTLEATIRRTLEDHSSDSANFRGADLFCLLGRGEWGLR